MPAVTIIGLKHFRCSISRVENSMININILIEHEKYLCLWHVHFCHKPGVFHLFTPVTGASIFETQHYFTLALLAIPPLPENYISHQWVKVLPTSSRQVPGIADLITNITTNSAIVGISFLYMELVFSPTTSFSQMLSIHGFWRVSRPVALNHWPSSTPNLICHLNFMRSYKPVLMQPGPSIFGMFVLLLVCTKTSSASLNSLSVRDTYFLI